MENKIIYVLHKSGANNHYLGLVELCKEYGYEVRFREFSIESKMFKSLMKFNFKLFQKQLINARFLRSLSKNKGWKIVLGIAPYDYKLPGLLKKLEHHQVYYHTSLTNWDGSYIPNTKHLTPNLVQKWKEFIEETSQHIFAVSEKTKSELEKVYQISSNKISVVYHSLNTKHFNHSKSNQNFNSDLEFIYAGRLISNKGLEELLKFFANNPNKKLKIAGKGKLKNLVEEYSKKYQNIIYLGQISNPDELATHFGKSHYLILNSKKSGKWEELFGMVIIEAMACGTIPIATTHTGPKEIIENKASGFLVNENEMSDFLANLSPNSYSEEMRQNAIEASKKYQIENIAQNWKAIFQD